MKKVNGCGRGIGLFLLLALVTVAARGQTFQSLISFDKADGAYPYYVSLARARWKLLRDNPTRRARERWSCIPNHA